jgi:hypothetical protein
MGYTFFGRLFVVEILAINLASDSGLSADSRFDALKCKHLKQECAALPLSTYLELVDDQNYKHHAHH